jgi:hypothetical protein
MQSRSTPSGRLVASSKCYALTVPQIDRRTPSPQARAHCGASGEGPSCLRGATTILPGARRWMPQQRSCSRATCQFMNCVRRGCSWLSGGWRRRFSRMRRASASCELGTLSVSRLCHRPARLSISPWRPQLSKGEASVASRECGGRSSLPSGEVSHRAPWLNVVRRASSASVNRPSARSAVFLLSQEVRHLELNFRACSNQASVA